MRLRYKEHKGKEMEIKLIVTDLDGTLLTKRMKCTLTISERLGAARNEG